MINLKPVLSGLKTIPIKAKHAINVSEYDGAIYVTVLTNNKKRKRFINKNAKCLLNDVICFLKRN